LSRQTTRAKSPRDDGPAAADQFGALVDQSTSNADLELAPAARPDIAPPPRRDDRPVTDRPKPDNRRDDRAASAPQDRPTTAATDTPRTGKAAAKDDKHGKTEQVADSKADSTNEQPDRKDTGSDTAATPDAAAVDPTAQAATLVAVPVAAVTVAAGPADATVASGTPQTAADAQPLAIATAAALKAKLDAGETAAPEAQALPNATPAEAEQTFAAMIAGATPGAARSAKKNETGETVKTAPASGETKADGKPETSATTAPAVPDAAPKPITADKPDQTAAEAPKPDVNATNTEPAKPAGDQHHAHRAEQTDAAPDLTAPNSAPPPQQTPVQTADNAVAAQQAAPLVAANPPVPLAGVAVEIAQSAKAGKTSFDIRLDPAELGRIDVRIEVDKHGNVTSHLTVEKPETLTMLRNDAPQLQRTLEQAGLKTHDGGLQFSLRDQSQQQQQHNGEQSGRPMHRLTINDDDTVTVAPPARGYGRMYGASGGVDISI